MNDLTRITGTRLSRARQEHGLSTRQLGGKACVSASTVSRAERGYEVYFSAIAAMASALGLSLDQLTAPPGCLVCDGMPPPGFTCQTCGSDGRRP